MNAFHEQPYYIAETTMPGKTGFDFNGASKGFNVLAEYLFGKVYGTVIFNDLSCSLSWQMKKN